MAIAEHLHLLRWLTARTGKNTNHVQALQRIRNARRAVPAHRFRRLQLALAPPLLAAAVEEEEPRRLLSHHHHHQRLHGKHLSC